MDYKRLGLFACGVLFGTAGIRMLSGRDAKKAYTHCVAATLRARDVLVTQATKLQENCLDIYEEAKQINEERKTEEDKEVFFGENNGV